MISPSELFGGVTNDEKESLRIFRTHLKSKRLIQFEMLITPRVALEMLKHNTLNRYVSPADVLFWKGEILSGRWSVLADGIAFDWNGIQADGQHRLFAEIEAKTPIRMMVTFGMDPKARLTIDMVTRDSFGVKLEGLGYSEGNYRAAIARFSIQVIYKPKARLALEQIEEFCKTYARELDYLVKRKAELRKHGISVPLLAGLTHALKNRPESTEAFIEVLISGVRRGTDDPASKFIELAGRSIRKASEREDVFTSGLGCIRAYLEERKMPRQTPGRTHLQFFIQ